MDSRRGFFAKILGVFGVVAVPKAALAKPCAVINRVPDVLWSSPPLEIWPKQINEDARMMEALMEHHERFVRKILQDWDKDFAFLSGDQWSPVRRISVVDPDGSSRTVTVNG